MAHSEGLGLKVSPQPGWDEILEKHKVALADDLARRIAVDIEDAVATAVAEERSQVDFRIGTACAEARRAQSERLTQSLRRLRAAPSAEKVLLFLNEACGPWAERSVILEFAADGPAGETSIRSITSTGLSSPGEITFGLTAAPAVRSVLESGEPLVTIASGDRISPTLSEAFGGGGDMDGYEKAYLFPLLVGDAPVAILIASGSVDQPPVELLCAATAMKLETLSSAARTESNPPPGSMQPSWEELSQDDQRIHLEAQRAARVRVAAMRLEEEDAFRRGQAAGNVYGALQTRIDEARREFLRLYLSRSATMVDYLHLEIVRSLAGGDVRLLGKDYPGPLV